MEPSPIYMDIKRYPRIVRISIFNDPSYVSRTTLLTWGCYLLFFIAKKLIRRLAYDPVLQDALIRIAKALQPFLWPVDNAHTAWCLSCWEQN